MAVIARPWVRFPAGLRCVFSSDPAVSSSIFVGAEREENLIGMIPTRVSLRIIICLNMYSCWVVMFIPFPLPQHQHTFLSETTFAGADGEEMVKLCLRPAGSDPEVVCQKNSFLKVSVSLGGFGPSVAHGKHSVRRRCVQVTKNKAETCSLLDAIGRRSCGR